ncbi:hypothetical protein BSK59_13920 [Paenibacillus odorifer]|uniref:hypothetical protein n=1 Tax=Paenibacillus odorifer TaxID=189426 RepID=UPI00096DB10F|nr:hypothetical protein [Paenibacillus odorifer]OME55567.1 hypothetical protein BSK59_13920 [Paenibacillus odorifer]
MIITTEQLEEIKNKRQFLSDTDSLLICQLIDEVEKLRDNRRSLSITYVELLIHYFEMLDDHLPEWRIFCEKEINQILKKFQ